MKPRKPIIKDKPAYTYGKSMQMLNTLVNVYHAALCEEGPGPGIVLKDRVKGTDLDAAISEKEFWEHVRGGIAEYCRGQNPAKVRGLIPAFRVMIQGMEQSVSPEEIDNVDDWG